MDKIDADVVLDTSGLLCPEPVMLLHNKIQEMATDQVLHVIATDPSTQRDIPRFCRFLGHELLSEKQQEMMYEYFIRKGDV